MNILTRQFFVLATLLGINLLTVSVPALAEDSPPNLNLNPNRGLGGQNITINIHTMPVYNGLPATNLDSFVYQAGAMADQIYGDESIQGPPEFMDGFGPNHRINAGITGVNDAGLTTGHGSYMPSAWGADEFLDAPGEWCMSGSSGGNEVQTGPNINVSFGQGMEAGAAASQIYAEIPNALGSVGVSGANGLGRVIGMPNSASMPLPFGIPGLPSL